MISTITRNNVIKKALKFSAAVIFWFGVWQSASMIVGENLKLFLPGPVSVIKSLGEIVQTADYWAATGMTLLRIFSGFALGVIFGIAAGVLTCGVDALDALLSPAFKVVRAVPVVSFIILAYLFIDVDNLPVFISFLMVLPMIWQTVHDGMKNADPKLCEMAVCFGFGRIKTLLAVRLLSCREALITACAGALGFAWKSGVAAEVLCTPEVSIGHHVYRAKGNLDFDEVYALTLTVVILSLIIEILFKSICKRHFAGKGGNNA